MQLKWVILFILAIVVLGVGFYVLRKPASKSPASAAISVYFPNAEECQITTGGSCVCMLTDIKTSQCTGWGP